ncbi:hypothetical protein [Lysinibacillus fusiformis]|uniref:hypothetical protein n=1 Tax=Lysinibacillus fusiformis TaxID=28031 RepID=UPI0027954FCD|nr:hypothetical protein [Lysinibacillus fusiformis]
MGKLPCEGCKGLCCGPVPITEKELKVIKRRLQSMLVKMRTELRHQQKFEGTCIFSIYKKIVVVFIQQDQKFVACLVITKNWLALEIQQWPRKQ